MAYDPKKLQQMKQPEVDTLEWSTISNVHGFSQVEDIPELIKQLQSLDAPPDILPMEWSTVSNVHRS